MVITRTEEKLCRSCLHKIDAHTYAGNDDKKPKENDLSICFYCGVWSKFDKDLNLVALAPGEVEEIKKTNPKSYDMLVMVGAIIADRISKQ